MKSFNTSFTGFSNLWLISQGPRHGYELINEVEPPQQPLLRCHILQLSVGSQLFYAL